MRLTWYGHAAFAVVGNNSTGQPVRVILDPYNYPGCGGYLAINEPADVVSVSHDNVRYHSDTSAILGDFELLEGLTYAGSTRTSRGVTFAAHEVYENAAREGPNAMVKFMLEELTLAHLGDLGHPLDRAALDFLRGTDVLLALAGGPPTLKLADLRRVVETIQPAVVVPMHFKTPKVNLNLLPLEATLETFADYPIRREASSSIELTRPALPEAPTIVVLDHAR